MKDKKYGLGLATAVRGLTRYYMRGKDCKDQSTALYWYPLVGAFLSLVALLPIVIINLIIYHSIYCLNSDARLLESALFVALLAYGSRGFHLDGLADTFDGFGGGYTKEKIMDIMKDSRIGSFGATALICLLMLKAIALSTVIGFNILIVIAIVMTGRSSLTLQCYISNYAKEYGLAKEVCDNANLKHLLVNFVFLLIPFYVLYSSGYLNIAIALFITMIVTTIVINKISLKKIGGITGDILGCTAESVELSCSIVIAFMLLA